jgi:hypothetical protein
MTPFVPLALFGWIPLVLYLFNRYPSQRAVIVSGITGFLFLPHVFRYPLVQGIPPYEKMSAISYIILLGIVLFDSGRLSSFKPGWMDIPMLIWCLCPIASQVTNGLSPISPTSAQIINWGVPYFIGRLYFSDLAGLRQLAIGIFAGGLVYVPLCLLETRIAPTLHLRLYGMHARPDFGQTMRWGGYRPTVFLEHGLAVGMWMMAAAFLGIVLWKADVIKKVWNYPMNWLVPIVVVTFILVKSTGAYLYLVMGLGAFLVAKWFRTALPLLLLVATISSYLYLGATGTLYTIPQVRTFMAASQQAGGDRSQSLAFRMVNEVMLSRKARVKAMFGWGDGGGNRIYDATGRDISVTDSIWIIAYGQNGAVGLASLTAAMLLPSLIFAFFRYPAKLWSNRKVAPAAGLALIVVMFMWDCSLNAFISPVYLMANGGLAGLVMKEPETNKVKKLRSSAPRRTLVQQR